ncbi:acyl carrier protein [Streptomyces sp. NPDC056503]|uniref:acyl carrier protein n=1 Tax=Streptomyces sp. NPDC056503 TaxID=3345842 RepID=UPI00368F01BB
MPVREGEIVQGRYQLQVLLGAGGFGQVWKASDHTLGREVAVKLATSLADDPQAGARFTAEARKLARLRHRGIVTVHDAGTATGPGRGVPFLVMELLSGSTWQQGTAPEPVDSVVGTAVSLAEALAYMHGMGIVHRDIKPANIMICADGQAVLMDLGIARDFSTLTTVTAAFSPGTPAYMAPEQLSGAPASAASDVYAFGLVLIQKITGKRGPAAQLSAADRARLTPPLHALLSRMTALEPDERPSMAECREQLGRVPRPGASGPAGHPPSGPAPLVPRRRGWWARWVGPQRLRQRTPTVRVTAAAPTTAPAGTSPSGSPSPGQREVLAGIAGILHEITGVPVGDVQLDKTFGRDLDVDSLSMVEVVVAAEELFGVRISDDEAQKLRTVRDATDHVLRERSRK